MNKFRMRYGIYVYLTHEVDRIISPNASAIPEKAPFYSIKFTSPDGNFY